PGGAVRGIQASRLELRTLVRVEQPFADENVEVLDDALTALLHIILLSSSRSALHGHLIIACHVVVACVSIRVLKSWSIDGLLLCCLSLALIEKFLVLCFYLGCVLEYHVVYVVRLDQNIIATVPALVVNRVAVSTVHLVLLHRLDLGR
ncbi:hypothetical protein PENTCL1PPCAC_26033, partial [Pristionchus entomophagus]